MGNFSSKDGHGPPGPHGESFYTPPATPHSDVPAATPGFPQLLQSSLAAPVSAPPPVPVLTGKKTQLAAAAIIISNPATPIASRPAPDRRPPPPVAVSPVHHHHHHHHNNNKPAAAATTTTTAVKGEVALGRNGGPLTSTPRTPVGPAKSPSSPPAGSSPGRSWGERDSGLSRSLLAAPDCGVELGRLLDECRTSLGLTDCHDGATSSAEILRPLLAEVKSLKSTLQTERGEWLQFQSDLQVAVSVADRLRAEAEEELAALRAAHGDVERELAAAQQRGREADVQLATLRAELQESRRRPAPGAEPTGGFEGREGGQRGTDRPAIGPGREGAERRRSENDPARNAGGEEARAGSKGVAKRYLSNVTNEGRSGEQAPPAETGRTVTAGRSRSLSRLPASSSSSSPAVQNGTSQLNAASTLGPSNTNSGQLRGRKNLDWQEGKLSTEIGKREETLNKYNSALTELPPTKSPDGFNLLLRRHGGSKRNSLLRWCQSRTQGYKNIDITNFSSSWADGLAFCAVYHTYLPSHVPYSSLTPENKRDNLSLAFKTGETVGIAQTLTVEETLRAGGPDWQRVLSYVESMYRHFEM